MLVIFYLFVMMMPVKVLQALLDVMMVASEAGFLQVRHTSQEAIAVVLLPASQHARPALALHPLHYKYCAVPEAGL